MLEQCSMKPEFGSISQLPLSRKQEDLPCPVLYPFYPYPYPNGITLAFSEWKFSGQEQLFVKLTWKELHVMKPLVHQRQLFLRCGLTYLLHSTPKNKISLYLIRVLEKPRKSQL